MDRKQECSKRRKDKLIKEQTDEIEEKKKTFIILRYETIYDNRLNWAEKTLFSLMESLDNEKGCYANYSFFVNVMQMGMRNIKNIIAKLKSFDLIKEISFNGRVKTFKTYPQNLLYLPIQNTQNRGEQNCTSKVQDNSPQRCSKLHTDSIVNSISDSTYLFYNTKKDISVFSDSPEGSSDKNTMLVSSDELDSSNNLILDHQPKIIDGVSEDNQIIPKSLTRSRSSNDKGKNLPIKIDLPDHESIKDTIIPISSISLDSSSKNEKDSMNKDSIIPSKQPIPDDEKSKKKHTNKHLMCSAPPPKNRLFNENNNLGTVKNKYISIWNNLGICKHRAGTKNYDKLCLFFKRLEKGTFDQNVDLYDFYDDFKVDGSLGKKKWLEREIIQIIKRLPELFIEGNYPLNKKSVPKNLSSLLYNPITKNSWFLYVAFHKNLAIEEKEIDMDKLPFHKQVWDMIISILDKQPTTTKDKKVLVRNIQTILDYHQNKIDWVKADDVNLMYMKIGDKKDYRPFIKTYIKFLEDRYNDFPITVNMLGVKSNNWSEFKQFFYEEYHFHL